MAVRQYLDDVWWLDTWNVPPQVADEIPHQRARMIVAVKAAVEEGRELGREDAEKNSNRRPRRRRK